MYYEFERHVSPTDKMELWTNANCSVKGFSSSVWDIENVTTSKLCVWSANDGPTVRCAFLWSKPHSSNLSVLWSSSLSQGESQKTTDRKDKFLDFSHQDLNMLQGLTSDVYFNISQVSDPFFVVFAFIFISAQLKFLHDIVSYGDPIRTWLYEYRVWMMKSGACYLYATLNAFLEKIGQNEASFSLTNKDIDDEQAKRYQQGVYDFQVSPQLLVPLCTLYMVNVAAFFFGVARMFCCHSVSELSAQAVLPFFGMILNYHLLEGMLFRQDKGHISSSVSLLSAGMSAIILSLGYLLLIH